MMANKDNIFFLEKNCVFAKKRERKERKRKRKRKRESEGKWDPEITQSRFQHWFL